MEFWPGLGRKLCQVVRPLLADVISQPCLLTVVVNRHGSLEPDIELLAWISLYNMKPLRFLAGLSAFVSFSGGFVAAANATYLPVAAPRANIFKELSRAEKDSVTAFMRTNIQNVDVRVVNVLLPNKTDALRYLDSSGTKPPRYARVLTHTNCYMKEYMVGPLPVGTTTKLLPLDYTFGGNGTYPFPGCRKNLMNVYLRNPTEDNGLSGTPNANDAKAAPMTILPEGPRYQYDPAEMYVSWSEYLGHLYSILAANKR
jgi:hypothetical protein